MDNDNSVNESQHVGKRHSAALLQLALLISSVWLLQSVNLLTLSKVGLFAILCVLAVPIAFYNLEFRLLTHRAIFKEITEKGSVSRTHSGRDGATPAETSGNTVADINKYRWKKHCRGLFQLPVAA